MKYRGGYIRKMYDGGIDPCVNPGTECAAKSLPTDHQKGKPCQPQKTLERETLLAQLIASDLSIPTNTSRSTTNPP
jgi:hypothetical protein